MINDVYLSVVVILIVGKFTSPAIMTGTTCRRMGIVTPWRQVYFFALSLPLYFIKQAALTAFCSVSLLGINQSCFSQIPQSSADGRLGQFKFRCNCRYGRPTFAVLVSSVKEININRHCTVRKLHAV